MHYHSTSHFRKEPVYLSACRSLVALPACLTHCLNRLLWREQRGDPGCFQMAGRVGCKDEGRRGNIIRRFVQDKPIILAQGVVEAVKPSTQLLYKPFDGLGTIFR